MLGLLLVFLFILNIFRAAPEKAKLRGASESLSGSCHNCASRSPKTSPTEATGPRHERANESSKGFGRPSQTLPPPVSPLQMKKCAIRARRVRVERVGPCWSPPFGSNCASLKGFATKLLLCWVSIEGTEREMRNAESSTPCEEPETVSSSGGRRVGTS